MPGERERERCCYDLQHSFYCRFTDLAEMVCKVRHSTPDRQFNMDDSIDMGETDSDQEDSDLVTDPEDYYMEVRKFFNTFLATFFTLSTTARRKCQQCSGQVLPGNYIVYNIIM